jgi:hypothetical protein
VNAEAQAWVDEGPLESPLPLAVLALARVRNGQPEISDIEARIASSDPGIGHFHHVDHILAQAHAQKGEVERSVSLLRQAAATGLACVVLLDTDPLLAPIRGSAPYAALRQDVERQVESDRAKLGNLIAEAGTPTPPAPGH